MALLPDAAQRLVEAIERYARRDDTQVAGLLWRLSPARGEAYLGSRPKRMLDVVLALPGTIAAFPAIVLLGGMNKALHPHAPIFYIQSRAGHGAPLRVIKLRSMRPGDGVITPFGRLIRRFYLDELPQIPQVLAGDLSAVGIRVLPIPIYESLRMQWSPGRFARWERAYRATPLALSGLHQVFRGPGKEDRERFHRDVFYHGHASLGLDVYILWHTLYRVVRGARWRRRGSRPE